ncbi:MAG: ATP-dependent proteinase, Serine peptidase, MEROPS family S16 [Candidatus Roizmanbacteria bacterium GW2011_GWA2_35_19]|uniref:ATP-dependent proteinase, Serine peptidase, MEROPS family S16 n=2 Tax=Candidatus Roizmaniibacteriota TaxID=1752723 RepID=A0A0G0EBZ6_9BACT|nr:MAG: ATP-dependent proteinase, Serine peptidase, MEROPS family S16 [Candidatus Roizmanbacteria bacterium GW2011_GWC2_35_12]KKP72715.1 MAG: ATP-dependent proteinase, Serine peptidase, MEROPS family S16 [Candidatus Roizmanbacteria bacterium GW2011_GWA2_35_19]
MDDKKSLSEIEKLRSALQTANLPANLHDKAAEQIERIELALKYGGNLSQLDITTKYIDWISHLPWYTQSNDVLDIKNAQEVLNKNHYGLGEIKKRVIEYLSVLLLQKAKDVDKLFHAPNLFFVGLAGTGKTTFAKSVAESLGRKFVRIPFGGLSSALDLRGQSKISPEAEPGMIMRAIRRAGVRNPVILLDELDRITPESRAAIMGVLIELLDPGQNANFADYFIDYPFDLSQVLFIATANNTNNISTAVMDRLEVIQMPSYTDEEKINIAKNYVFPKYVTEAGLTVDNIKIEDSLWEKITRPLGFDAGIRSLERTIEGIVRKVAYKIVSAQGQTFTINETNIKEYLS